VTAFPLYIEEVVAKLKDQHLMSPLGGSARHALRALFARLRSSRNAIVVV